MQMLEGSTGPSCVGNGTGSAATIKREQRQKVKVWCVLEQRPDKADRVGVVERRISEVVTV